MRRAVLRSAAAVLLAGPTVLAFYSGGYFDGPRLVATLVAWTVVVVVAVWSPKPLPASWAGRIALAGLALVAGWTGASIAWAPLSAPATDALVRLLLYVGALIAAMALVRERPVAPWVEPALALGAVVVIGYGLAGRLLPGIVHLAQSSTAQGRLEQPITYWNAEGALAGIGLVLCARLAGDRARPTAARVLATAASAPLGAGVYLSYSRGALAATIVGLVVLVAAAPSWPQLRAVAVSVVAGAAVAAVSGALRGVSSLEGSMGVREREGAIVLAVLVAVMLVAGALQRRMAAAEAGGTLAPGELRFARRLPALAAVALALGLAGLVAGGLQERGSSRELARPNQAGRLVSLKSRRYDYWRIGFRAFRQHPLKGLGAGGFRVVWLRERPTPAATLEVHSLPLEMATELGVVGLLGFGLFVGGIGVAAARALRRGSAVAAGAAASAAVFLLHSSIDWDWQVPAVTLPALILAGTLVAASEARPQPDASPAGAGVEERTHQGAAAAPG